MKTKSEQASIMESYESERHYDVLIGRDQMGLESSSAEQAQEEVRLFIDGFDDPIFTEDLARKIKIRELNGNGKILKVIQYGNKTSNS